MVNDEYASERGDPFGPQCGTYALLFDGYYLKLLTVGTVIKAWHARSGRKVSGVFDYTPARQKVRNEGPIPEGLYWIQPKQLATVWFGTDAWGGHRITIHPRPSTVVHSRGGFFIHGGIEYGSAGCIDLAHAINGFATEIQRIAPATPGRGCSGEVPNECFVPVTVLYATTSVGSP